MANNYLDGRRDIGMSGVRVSQYSSHPLTRTSTMDKATTLESWDSFIQACLAEGVPEQSVRWYVIRIERYLRAHADKPPSGHTADRVTAYLTSVGRHPGIRGWQFRQIVHALQIFFTRVLGVRVGQRLRLGVLERLR